MTHRAAQSRLALAKAQDGQAPSLAPRRPQAEAEELLAPALRQIAAAMVLTDPAGRTAWANPAFERLTGYAIEELRGHKPGQVLQGPATDPATVAAIREALADGVPISTEILNYRRDGQSYWVALDISPLTDADGARAGFIAVQADVTERRDREARLQAESARQDRAAALLRDLVEASPGAITAYDADERLLYFNQGYLDLFPLMAPVMRFGTRLEEVIRYGLAVGQYPEAGSTPEAQECWLRAYLAAHREPGPERELRLPDGRWLQLRERRSPSGHLVCFRTDITALKLAEARARQQAEQDPLTGLGNRTLFLRRLASLAAGRRAGDPAVGCLLLFDLDHFKATNDSLGHPAGDALLREIAARARPLLRADDTMARLGGDEFAILLPGIATPTQATAFIGRLRSEIERPIAIGRSRVTPSLSIGAALYPDDGGDAETLFRSADTALYQAKRLGRHCYSFFDRSVAAALERKTRMSEALREAIARENIEIALQPQCRVSDGTHLGFEALARWSSGECTILPAEFVPVAEEMGLILPLGTLVLRQTLAAVRRLRDLGFRPGRVAVNVATAQLLDDDLPELVMRELAAQRLGPESLEIELTETTLLDRSADRIAQILRRLRQAGIAVALDDFGTGYASLSHLTQFPVDRLKIDRRFVQGIGTDGAPSPIARTIVGLAHGLGMEAVAEGVETPAQLAYLREFGCDVAQGYLFSRPLVVEAAADYLREQERRHAEA